VVGKELLHEVKGLDQAETGWVGCAKVFIALHVAHGGDATVRRRAGTGEDKEIRDRVIRNGVLGVDILECGEDVENVIRTTVAAAVEACGKEV